MLISDVPSMLETYQYGTGSPVALITTLRAQLLMSNSAETTNKLHDVLNMC